VTLADGGAPWGLSGPAFLLLYSLAVLAGLAVAWWARSWSARTRPATEPSAVDFAEAALVAGGTDRLVDTVAARLVHSGHFRLSGKGVLSAPGGEPEHPVDADVWRALGSRSLKLYMLRKRVRAMPEVRALADRLAAARTGRSPRARALAKYGSMALQALVVVVGVVRVADGVAHGRPVAYLIILLMVSLAVIAAFYLAVWPLPSRPWRRDPVLVLARRTLTGPDRVAAEGLDAYPDERLRAVLVASGTAPAKKIRPVEPHRDYGPPPSSADGRGAGCGGGLP